MDQGNKKKYTVITDKREGKKYKPKPTRYTVQDLVKEDQRKKWHDVPTKNRRIASGLIGASVALMMSNSDDGLIETGLKMGIGAGIGLATSEGVNYITDKYGEQIRKSIVTAKSAIGLDTTESKNLVIGNKVITVGKMEADQATQAAKGRSVIGNETLEARANAKSNKMASRAKGLLGLGVAAFVSATILDVDRKLSSKSNAERRKGELERDQKKREHREEKIMGQMFGYSHAPDLGQTVLDLFKERIGHHKMGNAKFY